ncbi:MAG: TetR/AcrR family transcriptional regulator [Vibrio sp.]
MPDTTQQTAEKDNLKSTISARLEHAFSHDGFANLSVAQLRKACDVSLRTLYRYYPSKESMVIGALDFRHHTYKNQVIAALSQPIPQAIDALFSGLKTWMEQRAPNGCMSTHALNAYPNHPEISAAVNGHKQELLHLFIDFTQDEAKGTQLFIVHEGLSATWPVCGLDAVQHAKTMAFDLLK